MQKSLSLYPNPFEDHFNISFKLTASANIEMTVVDLHGREVGKVANGSINAGSHNLTWSPEDSLPNGIYIVRVRNGDYFEYQKVVLQR